ncbi:hypothetical protein MUK42_10056 [Musa troglodytarum]|uniref:Uncharacterized protein n=1 Tax=Musa troglodytarum TaxID=320322 RepID=A0A9E7EHW0_9LILI|nr:hypothetical protein MUK42_10056 [Musa troglodytarum]
MLFAVEGGGFFSSSASGYSNGLALLLLGQRNEDKPIKISSWNHYRLVEQEVEASSQLASNNDHASCGCASFSCFGCSSARLDEPYSRKWDEGKTCLKSNMKKPSKGYSMVCEADDARELLEEADNKMSCCTVGRKVQWTDKCGKELAEIREFEASDDGLSDDDFEGESFRRCECVIQ